MSKKQYPECPVTIACLINNGTLPIRLSNYLMNKITLTRDLDAIWVAANALKALPTADGIVTHKNFLSEVILDFSEDVSPYLRNVFCTGLLFPECPEARELVMSLINPINADMLENVGNNLDIPFDVNWGNFPKIVQRKKWFSPKHPQALLCKVASSGNKSNMLDAGITTRNRVERDLNSMDPLLDTSFSEDYADSEDHGATAPHDPLPIVEDPIPLRQIPIPPDALSYEETCGIIWAAIKLHKGCHITSHTVELYLRRYYISEGSGFAVSKQAVDKSTGVLMTELNDLIIHSIQESGFYTSKTQATPVFDISALKDQLERIVDVPNRIDSKIKFLEESVKNMMAYLKSGSRIEPSTLPAVLPVEKPLRDEIVQEIGADDEITDLSTLTYRP